jgi:hypothetical protein
MVLAKTNWLRLKKKRKGKWGPEINTNTQSCLEGFKEEQNPQVFGKRSGEALGTDYSSFGSGTFLLDHYN